jgi:Mg2+ and Co2+ transporter CorA
LDGLKAEIQETEDSLKEYRMMEIDAFIIPVPSDMPHGKGTVLSQVETVAIPRLTQIEHMENRLFYLRTMLASINTVINAYAKDSVEYKIIHLRYLSDKSNTWADIIGCLQYSERHIKRMDGLIVGKILSILYRKLNYSRA